MSQARAFSRSHIVTLSALGDEKPLVDRRRVVEHAVSRLHLQPGIEALFRLCDDAKPHPGVLCATKFRARAGVGSWSVRLQPDIAPASGYSVHLARQVGNPKIVNDVGGFDARAQPV